jgi:hypothetical protein
MRWNELATLLLLSGTPVGGEKLLCNSHLSD